MAKRPASEDMAEANGVSEAQADGSGEEKSSKPKPSRAAKKRKTLSPAKQEMYEFRKTLEDCSSRADHQRAISLFHEMRAKKLMPDSYMAGMLMNLCAVGGPECKEEAFALMDYVRAHGNGSSKESIGELGYTSAIKLCSATSDTEKGMELVHEMLQADILPKLRTISPLLEAVCRAGEKARAFELYSIMREKKIAVTEADYRVLLQMCCRLGDKDAFYSTLKEFAEDILVPSKASWEVVRGWFGIKEPELGLSKWKVQEETVNERGICSLSGSTLESVELSEEDATRLKTQIDGLVRSSERRAKQWASYKEWLAKQVEQTAQPYEVIIDGANVGYYKQNFAGGAFSFPQINSVVQHYEDLGKKVLLVLHRRHFDPLTLPPAAQPIVNSWKEKKILFTVAPGNNDDWYWLYAAVWLGGRTLVVSNDEMRDHHFQMLQQRSFERWKERHQVKFDLTGYQNHKVKVTEPPVYSRRIQHLKTQGSWHFPALDSDHWLCCYPEGDESSDS